jgi:hypothetical protein
LGICRLQKRGRAGQEVASWGVAELIKAAQDLAPAERGVLFDQVAWLCDGAGRQRLAQALDCYLTSAQKNDAEVGPIRQAAQVLLPLLSHLPSTFDACRVRLLALTSSGIDICSHVEPYLRKLASEVGACKNQRYERFRSSIEKSLASLLTSPESEELFGTAQDSKFPQTGDEFVPGAVVATLTDTTPNVGVIAKLEQRTWNSLAAGWDTTVVVKFADGERKMKPHTLQTKSVNLPPLAVLLRSDEANTLFQAVQHQQDGARQRLLA